MTDFVIRILERLNESVDLFIPVTDLLADIRAYFEFGCGFVYVANHKGEYTLEEHSEVYEQQHLSKSILLAEEIGGQAMEDLAGSKVIMLPIDRELTHLELQLQELFDAHSMIVIPIKDQRSQPIALVGMVDRRGAHRHHDKDLKLAYSLLAALANHIKLRLYQVRIDSAQKSLESIMDNMGVDIYVNDYETHEILYVNRSMAAPYGGVANMMGKTCWKTLYDDKVGQCEFCPQKRLIDENGEPTKIYSWDYERPFDHSWFRVLSAAFRWVDGRLAHVVSSVDITENKRNENTIRQLAESDALTGLPNRLKLMNDSAHNIARCLQSGKEGYLIFFDLDGFKNINDEIGHKAGDELLQEIARFLQSDPLLQGRCYRHGGDEFVALALDHDIGGVMRMVRRLLHRFDQPWKIEGREVNCRTSIGIAKCEQDVKGADDLIHRADMAMYAAKNGGASQARIGNGKGAFLLAHEYWAMRKKNVAAQ